jgi:Tfp pilus assembly protein PilO
MAIRTRDRRALQWGGVALAAWALLRFAALPAWDNWQQQRAELPLRETALIKYRQALAASGQDRESAEALRNRLREAEAGLLQSATPALAAAELQDWVREVAARHAIELRSSEFLAVPASTGDYAQVPLRLQLQCRLEQFVNFLSEVRSGGRILAVPRLQVQATGGDDKIVQVSLTIAGVMRAPQSPPGARP